MSRYTALKLAELENVSTKFETVELRPLHAVRIAPGTMHGCEAGPDGCELILFGAPRTGPGDAELEQGRWSD
jgi:hypothetical protein